MTSAVHGNQVENLCFRGSASRGGGAAQQVAGRSEAGKCSVNNEIRTCREGAGITRKVNTDGFQLFRLSEPSHRSHRVPLLDQRYKLGSCQNQVSSDVARADGVHTDTALGPFNGQRFRQLDDSGFRRIVRTLWLRYIDNVS